MGHYTYDADSLFRGVCYRQKTTAVMRTALEAKIERVNQLLKERTERVDKICSDFGISDQHLTNLILQYQGEDSSFISFESQGDQAMVVPAGAIANIVQEKKMSESERSQLRKVERVLRNLQEVELYENPETGEVKERKCIHLLLDSELEYLGF